MAVGLEMLAGTPRPVGENQAEKKASHRGHRGRGWRWAKMLDAGHLRPGARTRRKKETQV